MRKEKKKEAAPETTTKLTPPLPMMVAAFAAPLFPRGANHGIQWRAAVVAQPIHQHVWEMIDLPRWVPRKGGVRGGGACAGGLVSINQGRGRKTDIEGRGQYGVTMLGGGRLRIAPSWHC